MNNVHPVMQTILDTWIPRETMYTGPLFWCVRCLNVYSAERACCGEMTLQDVETMPPEDERACGQDAAASPEAEDCA